MRVTYHIDVIDYGEIALSPDDEGDVQLKLYDVRHENEVLWTLSSDEADDLLHGLHQACGRGDLC